MEVRKAVPYGTKIWIKPNNYPGEAITIEEARKTAAELTSLADEIEAEKKNPCPICDDKGCKVTVDMCDVCVDFAGLVEKGKKEVSESLAAMAKLERFIKTIGVKIKEVRIRWNTSGKCPCWQISYYRDNEEIIVVDEVLPAAILAMEPK